jgi:hypothetical protein
VVKLRRLGWVWHVVCIGDIINAYKMFVGNPEGNRPIGRPSPIQKDNIKIDI